MSQGPKGDSASSLPRIMLFFTPQSSCIASSSSELKITRKKVTMLSQSPSPWRKQRPSTSLSFARGGWMQMAMCPREENPDFSYDSKVRCQELMNECKSVTSVLVPALSLKYLGGRRFSGLCLISEMELTILPCFLPKDRYRSPMSKCA